MNTAGAAEAPQPSGRGGGGPSEVVLPAVCPSGLPASVGKAWAPLDRWRSAPKGVWAWQGQAGTTLNHQGLVVQIASSLRSGKSLYTLLLQTRGLSCSFLLQTLDLFLILLSQAKGPYPSLLPQTRDLSPSLRPRVVPSPSSLRPVVQAQPLAL